MEGVKRSISAVCFHPLTYVLVRIGLGGVFIVSGTLKLTDIPGFARIISSYGLAPQSLIDPVAVGLPVLELLAGLALLADIRGSLGAIAAMLLLFCLILWFGIVQELSIDCGCFSSREIAEQNGLRQAFYRDLFLIAGAAYLYFWRWKTGRPPRQAALLFKPILNRRS